ncbi:type II secretion system F family protein [Lignipirellula cremea]|uniref:Type II secretion system protein F n=1 Tax=Lignipirellula cremea TaxID=2528010 RepID=A0A518DZW7_9BACT|nr:type II secretion system F family protein [Lignipirellula cremea]QDU97390.1 Type II secretion system protein F [Lignipirellula cremea]
MPKPLSADELAALGDELAALARAGVPLDQGLLALRSELPGRAGFAAEEIGQRLAAGERWSDVVGEGQFPPMFAAVLEAGIRSSELGPAIEAYVATLRRTSELRKRLSIALLYPVLLLCLAYGLTLFIGLSWLPDLTSSYAESELETLPVLDSVSHWIVATRWFWAPLPPLLLLLGLGWWLLQLSGPALPRSRFALGVSVVRQGRAAIFADLLALLLERETDLPTALPLAAQASGDAQLQAGASKLVASLEQGSPVGETPELPPLIGWLLRSHAPEQQMVAALRRLSGQYHRRAIQRTEWLAHALPTWLAIGLGGGAAMLLASAVFGSWASVIYELARPHFFNAG